jgi:hypothetical protein
VFDLGSLSLLISLGKKLTGLGSDVQSKDRELILRFLNGLIERLEPIASAIRGGSEESLTQLCSKLEGYGKLGSTQLSAILPQANLVEISGISEVVGTVARDIREKNRTKWSPERRRRALRDLDDAIGQLCGMTSVLTDFHEGHSSAAKNVFGWTRKVSKYAATLGASALLTGAAKAASYLPGKMGTQTVEYLDGVKENISQVVSDAADGIDLTDVG